MADKAQFDAAAGLESKAIVGVAGAGAMGAGIAQVAALAGHRVLLYDVLPGAAASAIEGISTSLAHLVQKGKLSSERAAAAGQQLQPASALDAFAKCGLVLEAIVEDLEAKRALFRDVEKIAGSQTIFATNTSSLSITAMGAALTHPERLAGMHFFNPAAVMPLVEIVCGALTSPAVVDTLCATALRWGKTPVRARSTPGFIVNRVARPFYAEALRLLEEQAASCATIDAVFREAGAFRMGPFELMDLIGNDVNYAVTRSVFDAFYGHARFTPSNLQLELVQSGLLGRKSGRGFYIYEAGKPVGAPRTAEHAGAPSNIQVYGGTPAAEALAERLASFGVKFERFNAHADRRLAECGGCVVYRTDGRTATMRAETSGIRNTAVIDLCFDDRTATRIAVAAADRAEPHAIIAATSLLQSAGYAVSIVDDVPGLIAMRSVATLANAAADAVNQGVCTAADLDLAMCKGMNCPRGPLEWADAIGIDAILEVLDNLAQWYGEDRYRASPLLRRKAVAKAGFAAGASGKQEPRADALRGASRTEHGEHLRV